MYRWAAGGVAAVTISRQTAATMDDLIPKAAGPLLSHQPHTSTHSVPFCVVYQSNDHSLVQVRGLLRGKMMNEVSED